MEGKDLSRAGREVLVKIVAQTIPSNIMSCILLPDSLCSRIEGMISMFYWSGNVTKRRMHWLHWNSLCRSKDHGGLGFDDLRPLTWLWWVRIGGVLCPS